MIFKNIYVLAVTGASLITSTSIWLFTNSEVQKTLDSGDVKKPTVDAGSKDTAPKTKEVPQNPSAKPSTPVSEPKTAPAAPKREEAQTGKTNTPTTGGSAQSKPSAPQPSQPNKENGKVTMVTVNVPSEGKGETPDLDGILKNGIVIGGAKK